MSLLQSLPSLSTSNYLLFGLHLLAGLALLAFSYFRRDRNFNFEIFRSTRTYQLQSKYLVYAAAAFLLITAAFHLFYAQNKSYPKNAKSGHQSFRWLEFGITATIMAVIIAVISGVSNLYTLVALAGLTVGIMSMGLWFENVFSNNARMQALVPLVVGFLLLAVYVGVVFFSYRDTRDEYNAENSEPLPRWITWIVLGTLGFFAVFGLVPLARWFLKHNPLYSEYAYLELSAVSKLFLGAFLGYGLLQRTE